MKKLIRSKSTLLFLASERGDWTNDIAKAWRFEDYSLARALALRLRLQEVEAYFPFDESRATSRDFTMPLRVYAPRTTQRPVRPLGPPAHSLPLTSPINNSQC